MFFTELNTRTVVIAGSGSDNTLLYSSDFWFQQQIEQALGENLISYAGVRVTSGGGQVRFEVEVVALEQHSAETVRQLVQQAVANKWYTYNAPNPLYGPTGQPQQRRILSNVSTRVVRDDVLTQQGSNVTPAPPATRPPASSGGITSALPSIDPLSSFTGALGISTPIALIGGLVVLVILTRR